ncbi:hypothetical protein V8Z80_15295 [Orrella sp. JC864]|uniref:hypothetical protein n=1 Tax=Orrella sp. JC864 TaxID=3120298 RepID=UPI0030091B7A
MAEALLALPVLATLWLAVAYTGTVQHAGMQAADASRLAAFQAAAQADPLHPSAVPATVPGQAAGHGGDLRWHREPGADRVPAGAGHAQALRREWLAHEPGLLKAWASTVVPLPRLLRATQAEPAVRVVRHTSLATGAAHSSTDLQTQRRIALSSTGWTQAADASMARGARVAAFMKAVDRPWPRTAPDFDWLGAWRAVVPERLLRAPRPWGAP